MLSYLLKRLALLIPTLLGIMTINFFIVQLAPGGPVEQMMAKLANIDNTKSGALTRISGGIGDGMNNTNNNQYRGSAGLDDELLATIQKAYGFDKTLLERYFLMLKSYLLFDFGNSFFRDDSVIDIIIEKMPVSISLGLWTTIIVYLIAIPLGIKKAWHNHSSFDITTSTIIIILYAIPVFLLAILLIIVFAGGEYWQWFPLRGLVSDDFASLSLWGKIKDYIWHLTLPIIAMSIGSFATLTMLAKNSFLDEINKQYVITARAKGIHENRVLYGHIFRNAMLIIIAGFPATFIGAFFTGSLLIEVIFSLDGLGLLGFEATIQRDYPLMFGTLYIFTLLSLIISIINDIVYTLVDPRINFNKR